jgi:hypothetical protein
VATKLINQDNVTSGLRTVTQVLNPFIQQHMSKAYGKNWLPAFVQRHPKTGSGQDHLGDLGYLIWVLTKEERAFKSVLTPRARNLAHRVREARNLTSHDQLNDIDQETARAALQSMAEFLKLIGASGEAGEVQQFARQLRPAGRTKPHVVKPSRPQSPSRPTPKKTTRRPVIQIKLGCGAVAALTLIAAATAWVFLAPKKASPYEGKYKDKPVGARLNSASIEVPDDYHLNLLDEPIIPVQGQFDGDLILTNGEVSVQDGHIALLTRKEKLTYATCQANTRFTASAKITKGLRFCVTTNSGLVTAGTVKGSRRLGANTYTKLDLIVWKGRKPNT